MRRLSQEQLNAELRARRFEPTSLRTRGGHRIWKAPNKRFVSVPDWNGSYGFSVLDEIIRVAYSFPTNSPDSLS